MMLDAVAGLCYFTAAMNTARKVFSRFSVSSALLIGAGIILIFGVGACKRPQTADTTKAGSNPPVVEGPHAGKDLKLYKPDMTNCSGFTAEDAAAIFGLPAPRITAKTEELYAGNWQCSFDSGDLGKTLSFNVRVSKAIEDAVREMAGYRSHLETAGSVSPFKENLPKGAYSDIGGIGDEAVWTDINASLAVRRGNVTIHVSLPKDRPVQIKIAEAFLSKLNK